MSAWRLFVEAAVEASELNPLGSGHYGAGSK
jgi:hypothetical protein